MTDKSKKPVKKPRKPYRLEDRLIVVDTDGSTRPDVAKALVDAFLRNPNRY